MSSLLLTTTMQHNNCLQQKWTHIVIPYAKYLSESFKNTCGKHRIQVFFRGGNTIRNFLLGPMDKDNITKKSSVIYIFNGERLEHGEEYIGE